MFPSGLPVATVLLVIAVCMGCKPGYRAQSSSPAEVQDVASRSNVVAARELDQEGVRDFREGRYMDAAQYFRAALRLGGPSSELWNIARCRERIDDAEGAAAALDEYLAQRDLSPRDRAEAEREGRALRTRPSVLTVTTTPGGAAVAIDGKQAPAPTPVSVEVSSGRHSVEVRLAGYAPETRPVEARFGRAVIVSLDLARAGK